MVNHVELNSKRKRVECCTQGIKKPLHFCKGLILLVAGTGLEPATFGL